MSSDTSYSDNSSSSKNKQAKQKTSFSTDYMVNYLQDSPKLKPEDERIYYNKSDDNNSNSSDITKYIKSDNDTRKNSESNTGHTHGGSGGQSNHNNNHNDNNIFQKSIQPQNYRFDNQGQGQEQENKKDIPEDYDNYNELSEEGKMLKRLDMLRKLGELAQYKVKLSQNYNMNSDYFTMKYEYQLHTNIRAKQNFVNWTSSLMLNCIYGIEILNDKYNPFELKLTGWSEQINADITNYYDVFGEIYEKYNKPGKSMSPELKLILMIGGSALKFHLNNVAMSGRLGLPNMQQMNRLGSSGGPMGSQENVPGQDPKVIEQMRQQAMIDRMREETRRQAEVLQKKSEEQHEQANKQMQDMMLLQQKQNEFNQKDTVQRQKMQEFERIRALMEQQAQTQTQPQPRPTLATNPYSPMSNLQQFNGPPVQAFAAQRRDEIGQQLLNMKNNLPQNNSPIKSQDPRELNAERFNARNPPVNVKKRNGVTVDTSSEESSRKSSSTSESSSSKQSSLSSSSSSSTSTSSSSSDSNVKSKSQGSSKRNFIDKSLSSRNNQSTLSKRKYKKQLTFDTS